MSLKICSNIKVILEAKTLLETSPLTKEKIKLPKVHGKPQTLSGSEERGCYANHTQPETFDVVINTNIVKKKLYSFRVLSVVLVSCIFK